MKSPNKLISSLIAGITTISVAQAQQYSASPVYDAPVIASDGQSATVSGSWSPVGIDPVNFQAIISLAYTSSSVYQLETTQITGTGTGVGANDSYTYSLASSAPSNGDVVTMSIDYINIDIAGPASNITWDRTPGYTLNRAFNQDQTVDYTATIAGSTTAESERSIFEAYSTTFSISGSDSAVTSELGTGAESPAASDDAGVTLDTSTQRNTDGVVSTLGSDGLIFTSAKAGPATWEATAVAVPEPSSTILLALSGVVLLRRKR